MKIIVCAKQVPDTTEVKIDPVKGTLIRDGVPSILNPDDANALEAALQIKDADPSTTVTIVSMGPPQAAEMIRECLAMGADNGVLLSDRAFGGADTIATSSQIAEAIRKIGDYDIVFAGRQAIDGDTAQVGPQIARRIGLPCVTYVQKIREFKDGKVIVERQLEDGYEVLEVQMPCLLTAVKELNTPRYMTVAGIMNAYKADIKVWNHNDLGMDPENCGLSASPTQVLRSFTPAPKGKGEMASGSVKQMTETLVSRLSEKHLI